LPFMPEQASTVASRVDNLYAFLVATTIFFTVLISSTLLFFFLKYRRRSENTIPKPIAGSIKLELLWTIIPFIIAMCMFFWGASVFFAQYRIPENASDIYVVGKQWMWKFQHPEGQREINELHIPIGKRIRLTMASEDVIHSFFVPAFRVKQDVVPGPNRYEQMWFEATKSGAYHLFCAEYCGTNHAAMIGTIYVMEPKAYAQWLDGGATEGTLQQKGEKLFTDFGCITCHKSDGSGRGPNLEGLYGKQQQLTTGERVLADENYIRQSVLNPGSQIVAGYQPVMPSFQGQISEEQLIQMLAYLKSLTPQQPTTGGPAENPVPVDTSKPAAH
jgi:cytochrome c oxidase subunit 2